MTKNFNNNLKYLRKLFDVSQQEIAHKIKVDRSSISRWEKGKIDIPLEAALNIADFFNIKCEFLFREDLTKITKEELQNYLKEKTTTK